jgi:hypothetical protein|tara:strand:+ start:420 stop:758 length:339 start_codon:yes stop_codon:yes gene_type:complete
MTNKSKKQWKIKDLQILLKSRADGGSDKEIAELLGRSEKAVQVKSSKLRKQMEIPYQLRGKPMDFIPPKPMGLEDKDPEPLFLERKHVKFITLWGAVVVALLAALLVERLMQ